MFKNTPESWPIVSAQNLISESLGGVNPASVPNETFELFSIPGFDSGSPEVVKGKSIGSNKQLVKEGQVLLSKINPRISRVWIVKPNTSFRAIASTEWIAFNCNGVFIDRFLKYFLSTEPVRVYLASKVTGSGGSLQRVNKNTVSQLNVPLPPRGEQLRIVAKIESTQEKIKIIEECTTRAKELMGKYRESILQKAFRGELVSQDPNDEPASQILDHIQANRAKQIDGKKKKDDLLFAQPGEIPFEVPKSWAWVRLGEIASSITDGDHQTPKRTSSGEVMLSAKNIRDGFLSFDDTDFISKADYVKSRERCCPAKGDLLMVSVGATIGRCAVVKDKSNFSLVRSVALIRCEALNSDLLYFLMQTNFLKRQIKDSQKSTGQPCLYLRAIGNLLVPLIPKQEQTRITEALLSKLTIMSSIKEQIAEIENICSVGEESVLATAFSGRLVPQIKGEGTGHELLIKIKSNQSSQADGKAETKKRVKA